MARMGPIAATDWQASGASRGGSFGQRVTGQWIGTELGRGAAMKMPRNLGMLLLAVWLILFGLLTAPFLKINFAYSGDILAVLAISAGVLLLMQR
jgi:hypothetical protein